MFDKLELNNAYRLLDLTELEKLFDDENKLSKELYEKWKESNQKLSLLNSIISYRKNETFKENNK